MTIPGSGFQVQGSRFKVPGSSAIGVHGLGAISPAGWGVDSLYEAWKKDVPLPVGQVARPGWDKPIAIRNIPAPPVRPAFLAHPRLRRATAIGQHTLAAALEAFGPDIEKIRSGAIKPGIIVCVLSGVVNYSRRFYEEVLREPATASPLLFPETVFNSSASHLAAFLGVTTINYTLVGDGGTFLQGLALAADWLAEGRVDSCVVVGAEENDWILSDALRLFQRDAVHATGAGALYLKKDPAGVELAAITDPMLLTQTGGRAAALQKVREQLPPAAVSEWFMSDKAKAIFGEAFTAGAAWQCVLACDAIRRREITAGNVSVSGTNQQAIGARFVRA